VKPLAPKVALAGGGTGGHVFPVQSVFEALKARGVQDFLLVSDTRAEKAGLLSAFEGRPKILLQPAGLSYRPSLKGAWAAAKLTGNVLRCLSAFKRYQPDVLFATGSYTGASACAAAHLLKIPSVLYEGDARPGRANLRSARWAQSVAVAFEEAKEFFPPEKVHFTGPPLRTFDVTLQKAAARTRLGLDQNLPVVAVLGGSQGAAVLNAFAVEFLAPLVSEGRLQVIHQCGQRALEAQREALECKFGGELPAGYKLFGFLEEIAAVYVTADLVISRAGSSTIGEEALFGVASLLVPLEGAAGGHQKYNAQAAVRAGRALAASEADCASGKLVELVLELLQDEARLARLREAARRCARPDAATRLAELVLEAVQEEKNSSG